MANNIQDTREYKRIQAILDSITYSKTNPRLNHFYHKGFLMAVMARAAMDDTKILEYLEAAKRDLVRQGWRQDLGRESVTKIKTEPKD